jgi:hypothetical protein
MMERNHLEDIGVDGRIMLKTGLAKSAIARQGPD